MTEDNDESYLRTGDLMLIDSEEKAIKRQQREYPRGYQPGLIIKRSVLTTVVGGIWFQFGFVYLASTTRGLRLAPKMIDFNKSSSRLTTRPSRDL